MLSSFVLTSLVTLVASAQIRARDGTAAPSIVRAAGAPSAADSLRIVRAARRAQEQFEWVRRSNLPFLPGQPRGPCDLLVGRLCYWHEDGVASPIAEPDRIASARLRLVATLDSASRLLGGDEWIAGQRVRYLLESGRRDDAIAAAVSCRSTTWWCAALVGLALHQAQAYDRADSAFAVALAAMPADQRCKWTDLSLVLEAEVAKTYRRLSCDDRGVFERRFWWLAKPLYGLPGNDARTEFLARRVMARIERHAKSGYDLSWGSDVEELLLRYGWPTWWTRDHPSSLTAAQSIVVAGHEPTPSFYFYPSARLLGAEAADARADDWQPGTKLPPARYAPAYAASFSDLETQSAIFRRRDTAVVVVAYEVPNDSLLGNEELTAMLAVGHDERSPMTTVRSHSTDRVGAPLVARVLWGPAVLSLELTAPRTRGAARARFGVRPRATWSRLGLSDMLLFRADDAADATFEHAVLHALGAPRIVAGGRVGVYWETYGVRATGEPLAVTLTVERTAAGWRTRTAERLGLVSKVTPLRVRWQEVPAPQSGVAARAIAVDLSAMPAGRYRIELSVAAQDGSLAVVDRYLELTSSR